MTSDKFSQTDACCVGCIHTSRRPEVEGVGADEQLQLADQMLLFSNFLTTSTKSHRCRVSPARTLLREGRLTQRRDYGRDHAQRTQRRLSTPPFSASLPRSQQQTQGTLSLPNGSSSTTETSGLRLTFFTILQWQCGAHRSTSMFAGAELLQDLSCKLPQNLANALKLTGSAQHLRFLRPRCAS